MSAADYQLLASQPNAEATTRRTLELLTTDLRALALLALAQWQSLAIPTPQLLPSLAALQNPSPGTWNGILQLILDSRQKDLASADAAMRQKIATAAPLQSLADLWSQKLPALQPLADLTGTDASPTLGTALQGALQISARAVMSNQPPAWEHAAKLLRPLITYLAQDPFAAILAAAPAQAAPSAPAFSALIGQPNLPEKDLQQLLARNAPQDFPGVLLGDFLVGRPVGEGGFGTVHVARQLSTGRKVALKLLHDGMAPEIHARFQREAAYLARFNHPHIVGVLAYGKARWSTPAESRVVEEPWYSFFARSAPEKTFIALESIEGQTLDAIYRQSKDPAPALGAHSVPPAPPSVRTLAEWFAQAAGALHAVHSAGLVHRDVKPSNLMVTDDGTIKLMDFGIARTQDDNRTLVTQTGRVFGTLVYMSPEQIRAAQADALVGPATDIYSLCATFYELFTRTRLFEHDTQSMEAVKTRKLTGERPSPPRTRVRDLPWEIEVILLGGLEAEVTDRYRTMEALESDLRNFLRDDPIAYRRPGLTRRAQLAYRRHRTLAHVAAAGLLVTMIAAAVGTTLYRRAAAREQAALALSLEERGRQELLAGQPLRAATFLSQAYAMGRNDSALRFMLAASLRALPSQTAAAQGHTKGVYTAEYNRDASKIVTAGRDGTVRIWDAKSGAALTLTLNADHEVSGAMFDPDGTRVVAADDGGNAALWDAATGKKILTLQNPPKKLYTPRFSPTGARILIACDDGNARVFDAATGALLKELPHNGPVVCAFFNWDETRIVTGSDDRNATLWDGQTYARIADLPATEKVTRAVFSPDGTKVAVASLDPFSGIKIYDARTGGRLQGGITRREDIVRRVIFSPDGTKLVASNRDGISRWSDLESGQTVPLEHDQGVFSAAFSHNGKLFGTAGRNGRVKLWNADAGTFVRELVGHTGPVYQLAFTPDDYQILTAGEDATARIWDAKTGQLLHTVDGRPFTRVSTKPGDTTDPSNPFLLAITESSNITRGTFTPDGRGILLSSEIPAVRDAGTGAGTADIVSMTGRAAASCLSRDGKIIAAVDSSGGVAVQPVRGDAIEFIHLNTIFLPPVATAPAPRPMPYCVAFSPNGKWLIVGCTDGAWVLEAATLRAEHAIVHGKARSDVLHAEFSPDSRSVVTAGTDGTAQIWDMSTGQTKTLPHKATVNWATYSPDGKTILTASNDGDAALWDAASATRLRTFNQGNKDYVTMAAFSPDAARIVTANRDYTARVYDTSAGTLIATLQGHTNKVTSANFSPDGQFLATSSEDGSAKLWEAASGKLLYSLAGHKGDVRWAEFSPDGARLITTSDDRRAILWDTHLESRSAAEIQALLR